MYSKIEELVHSEDGKMLAGIIQDVDVVSLDVARP